MKWKAKKPPKEGDVKYTTIFPLIPKLIDDTWYWLEKVSVKYEYKFIVTDSKYNGYYFYDVEEYVWVFVGLDDRLKPSECEWKIYN